MKFHVYCIGTEGQKWFEWLQQSKGYSFLAEMRLIYCVLSLLSKDLKETTLLAAGFKCIRFKVLSDEWKEKSRGTWNKGNQSFYIS